MLIPKFKLSLLDDFQCLAADCPDDCCSYDWDITVEEHILEKWRGLSDSDLKHRMLGVVKEKELNGKRVYYLACDGQLCSLQDEKGLCMIHANLGPEYLSKTCRQYPRAEPQHANYLLSSAHMSCPEVARMIVEHKSNNDVFKLEGDLSKVEEPGKSINEFVTKIIAKSDYTIAARILTISRFLVEISLLAQRGELDLPSLHALCRKIGKPLKDAEREIKTRHLKRNEETSGRFWYMVYKLITTNMSYRQDERVKNHPLAEKFAEKISAPEFYHELSRQINRIRLASSESLQKQMQGIGERYLQVKFKSIGFPLSPPADNYIAAFLFGVLPYCFINLNLWMIYDVEKTITTQDIVNVIYRTERIVQHTERIYNAILDNHAILRIDEYGDCFSDLI